MTAAELASENRSDEFHERAIAQAEAAFPVDWVKRVGAGGGRPLLGFASVSLFLFVVIVWGQGSVLWQALWPFRPEATKIDRWILGTRSFQGATT